MQVSLEQYEAGPGRETLSLVELFMIIPSFCSNKSVIAAVQKGSVRIIRFAYSAAKNLENSCILIYFQVTLFLKYEEGGWCKMKRNRIRRFFQQKQYAIASLVLFAAIAGMTGIYVSNKITDERLEEEMAQKEAELSEAAEREREELAALEQQETNPFADMTKDTQEDTESVSSIIKPESQTGEQTSEQDENGTQSGTDTQEENKPQEDTQNTDQTNADDQESQTDQSQEKKAKDTAAKAKAELHFSPESDLGWPLQGDVILNYSMDQTVYFATLEQYKYNPAIIIAGKVNDPVNAAATGKITDISTNEETGVTVTMDLGDGYSAVYGQLKEVLYKEGAAVEAGNAIGYIAEPTKYYSVEGSNLYFELQKDGEPVNPMQYIQ